MTTVDGLEPTETRLTLCAAIALGDVRLSSEDEWVLVYRESGRQYVRTAAVRELIAVGWVASWTGTGLRAVLTELGQAMLDEHGGKVLKRYRETT